jgi:hypothetical protein
MGNWELGIEELAMGASHICKKTKKSTIFVSCYSNPFRIAITN